MDLFDLVIAKKLAGGGGGGGGGASNVVTGTFKGTENGAMDVSVPYTGDGYPVNVMIAPVHGCNNPDKQDYSGLIQNNAVGLLFISKQKPEVAPTWTNENVDENKGVGVAFYKASSSSATSYTRSSTNSYLYFVPSSAESSGQYTVCHMKSSTVMSVYVADSGNSFAKNIEYRYTIQYSS